MSNRILLVPFLFLSLPAIAQTVVPPIQPVSAPATQPPLAAMRHQQPSQGEVQQREADRISPAAADEQQRRERAEVDAIYDEVMRRSAPASAATERR